nr:hypothetical protein [Nitrospirota bacterium]
MGPELILVAAVYFCSESNTFIDHLEEGCTPLSAEDSKGGFGAVEPSSARKSRAASRQGMASVAEPAQPERDSAAQQREAQRQRCLDYAEWIALGKQVHGKAGVTRQEIERHQELSQSFARVPGPKCER